LAFDFYRKCQALAEKFADAEAHIQSLGGSPREKLKIASSVAFGKSQLIPVLPKFLNANPDVSVALDLTDRYIDIEAERFDVAICFGEQRKMSDIVVRKFMNSQRILCEAPAYLERAGHPQSFADLAQHNCLRLEGNYERNEWIWQSDAKGANFEGNSTDVVFRATRAGLGIARLPSYLVAAKLQSVELICVLPDYSQQNAEIAMLLADKRNLVHRIRVFVGFLVEEFRSGP